MTFDEYNALGRESGARFEFHNGIAFEISGASPAHSSIQVNCLVALRRRLSPGIVSPSSLRIFIPATGLYTYADLSIYTEPLALAHDFSYTNPKILFEVLSPSTRRYDCIGKSEHYRQIPSLEEYVLVEQDSYSVDRCRRMPDGQWEFTSIQGEDAVLELASVNVTVPLREIYADVPFDLAETDPEQP